MQGWSMEGGLRVQGLVVQGGGLGKAVCHEGGLRCRLVVQR